MKGLTKLAWYGLLTFGNKVLSIYRLKLTRAMLQQAMAPRFPLQAGTYPLLILLTDPMVQLQEDTQRIGIVFTATASLPGKLSWRWRGMLDGGLEYRREAAAFYLRDLRIRRIDAEPAAQPSASPPTLVERILRTALADYPLYRLDDGDLKQVIAKVFLKSVRIGKDSVLIELSLY